MLNRFDGNSERRAARTFDNRLAVHVQELHGGRCPCCGVKMLPARSRRRNPTAQARRERASVAHDVPVALGGNPAVWVYACRGCNTDQGALPFAAWSYMLRRRGDGRADAVGELADVIRSWLEKNDVKPRLTRRDA